MGKHAVNQFGSAPDEGRHLMRVQSRPSLALPMCVQRTLQRCSVEIPPTGVLSMEVVYAALDTATVDERDMAMRALLAAGILI